MHDATNYLHALFSDDAATTLKIGQTEKSTKFIHPGVILTTMTENNKQNVKNCYTPWRSHIISHTI